MSSPLSSPQATPPRLRRNVSPPVTPDRPRLLAQVHLHQAASRRAMYTRRLAEHNRRAGRQTIAFIRPVEQDYMATGGIRNGHECLIPVDIYLEPEVPVALPASVEKAPVALPVIGRPVGGVWRVWGATRGAFRTVWVRIGRAVAFMLRLWIHGCAYGRERSMGGGN